MKEALFVLRHKKWYYYCSMKNKTVSVTNQTKISQKMLIYISIFVLILLGLSTFLFTKFGPSAKKTIVPKIDAKKEADELLAQIGKLFDLPTGETPTIATVSDKTKLEKQSFFAKAENGDKVLIYSVAKKAILYRPSAHKIMEVAPLAITAPTAIPVVPTVNVIEVDPSPIKKTTISIYNGTKTAGLASSAEKKVGESISAVEVVEKGNTVKDYTKTVVVDISGSNSALAKKIANLFEGSVGPLPEGEQQPKGEILVIMGK